MILLTGFTPFDGSGLNASEELVRSLEREPPGDDFARVRFLVLPTDTAEAPRRLDEALEELRPEAVLLTGQARRNHVALERVALNLRDFSDPDASGTRVEDQPVDPDGPLALRSNLGDLPQIVENLRQAGIPARVSNHAGCHLCNQTLYHALRRGFRAGFMHVPLLPEQVVRKWRDEPFMPLEMTRRAAALVVAATASRAARPRPSPRRPRR